MPTADHSAPKAGFLRNVLLSVAALGITLVGLEAALWLLGFRPHFTPSDWRSTDKPVATLDPVWVCDDMGCRYDREQIDPSVDPQSRLSIINEQGFHDQDQFVRSEALEEAYRILVLGDSFTFGASADLGHSWVELVEAQSQEQGRVIVWNAGIPGTGTNQAWATLQALFPVMQPDLVVVGFFAGNDFDDNLYPLDRWVITSDTVKTTQYELDANLVPIKLSASDIYRQSIGLWPIEHVGTVERLVRSTNLGSLAWQGTVGLRHKNAQWDKSVRDTENLLEQVRDYVADHDSRLVVLIIPPASELGTQGQKHLEALRIAQDLSIDYVDSSGVLEAEDYTSLTFPHWTNSGHEKVARLMMDHILPLIDSSQAARQD